jgi:cobalamin biosynthesis protein CobD/CbiB
LANDQFCDVANFIGSRLTVLILFSVAGLCRENFAIFMFAFLGVVCVGFGKEKQA